MKTKKIRKTFVAAMVFASLALCAMPALAQQASIVLKNSDVVLCHENNTEWTLTKTANPIAADGTVTWTVTATKGETGANFLTADGFVTVYNSGTADATIGNIVVNLQRFKNLGTAKKPNWSWVTVSSDVADATLGDAATTALICSGASSEGKSSFSENAASGKLEFTDADSNTIWAITPQQKIASYATVNLIFQAQFNNSILSIPAGKQVRIEAIVTFGNAGARGGGGAVCRGGTDINSYGAFDTDEYYVRSVPTRITKAVPALVECNKTVTLKDTGITTTDSVTFTSADYAGYDAGIAITDTTTFTVTAYGVDGGAAGGSICNTATLQGESGNVSVIIGYNTETITNPDGTTRKRSRCGASWVTSPAWQPRL
jgi:hypothetical protein